MSSTNVDPPAESPRPTGGGPPVEGGAGRPGPSRVRVWAFALIAGAIAGVASWGVGERVEGRFRPPLEVASATGFPSPEESKAATARFRRGEALEASAAFGIMGVFLGCCLGAAGGLARGSGRSALVVGAGGAIFGAVAGAAAGWLLTPLHYQLVSSGGDDLLQAILIQSGIGLPLGAVGGAALGLGLGGRSSALRAALGGAVGAIVGAMAFQLIGAIALPLDGATNPLPETSVSRLVARLVPAILISLGAAREACRGPAAEPLKEGVTTAPEQPGPAPA